MRVAIVCSWLNQYGGAERVLEVLHDMFPEAPVFTSMFEPRAMPSHYGKWDIRTSFMQRLPLVKRRHQLFLPLYPLAFEQFDLSGYDVVISNSSAFAHGVVTGPGTCHICYCLTPARFIWNYPEYIRREPVGRAVRSVLPPLLSYLRTWDALAANRVDYFVAISSVVASRIQKYYGRRSKVIYPPVNVSQYAVSDELDEFFLVVSRLIPYKRIDLAIRAFNDLGQRLVVVGGGRDKQALERIAGPTVRFLGRVPDAELMRLYSRCKALIFPGEEDFGLTPLEANASGRPVIAYAGGGALDTVIDGQTGLLFREPSASALADAVRRFDSTAFDAAALREHAARFDVSVFKRQLGSFVEQSLLASRQTAFDDKPRLSPDHGA